jgi:hypothetical protein
MRAERSGERRKVGEMSSAFDACENTWMENVCRVHVLKAVEYACKCSD